MTISEAYTILGLPYGATSKEVKSSYRKLAKKWHPDLNKDEGASKRFIRITKAYERLTSSEMRVDNPFVILEDYLDMIAWMMGYSNRRQ